jgi:hypothetical protein
LNSKDDGYKKSEGMPRAGDPDWTQTNDLPAKSGMLYQLSLLIA